MRVYVFLCNNKTMTDCLTCNIFGIDKPYVSDIEIGDFCLLYNYSDKKVYGVWKATSRCGHHNPKLWGGRFKFQVRVELISKTYDSIRFDKLGNNMIVDNEIKWKYYDDNASNLLKHFSLKLSPVP